MFLEKKKPFREDGLLKTHTHSPAPTPAERAVLFLQREPVEPSQAPTSPSLRGPLRETPRSGRGRFLSASEDRGAFPWGRCPRVTVRLSSP